MSFDLPIRDIISIISTFLFLSSRSYPFFEKLSDVFALRRFDFVGATFKGILRPSSIILFQCFRTNPVKFFFRAPSLLNYSTNYTLTVPVAAVKDAAGNSLASSAKIGFSTEPKPDTVPPVITATKPINGEKNVPINSKITITFDEAIQAGDYAGGITIKKGTKSVNYTLTIVNNQLIITPGTLSPRSTYTVYIPKGAVKDNAGNSLSTTNTFSFATLRK
jgi:hypothetical protein